MLIGNNDAEIGFSAKRCRSGLCPRTAQNHWLFGASLQVLALVLWHAPGTGHRPEPVPHVVRTR